MASNVLAVLVCEAGIAWRELPVCVRWLVAQCGPVLGVYAVLRVFVAVCW